MAAKIKMASYRKAIDGTHMVDAANLTVGEDNPHYRIASEYVLKNHEKDVGLERCYEYVGDQLYMEYQIESIPMAALVANDSRPKNIRVVFVTRWFQGAHVTIFEREDWNING